MTWRLFPSAVLLRSSQFCFAQQSAKNSEAAAVGLHGHVHTVLTESLDYRGNPQGNPTNSNQI